MVETDLVGYRFDVHSIQNQQEWCSNKLACSDRKVGALLGLAFGDSATSFDIHRGREQRLINEGLEPESGGVAFLSKLEHHGVH